MISNKGTLNKLLDSGNLLCRMKNEIGPFLQNSLIYPKNFKLPKFINYNGLATMSHGCEEYFFPLQP